MKRLSATPNRRISYQPKLTAVAAALLLAGLGAAPMAAHAVVLSNPICPDNAANYSPGTGADIVLPPGFKVSVFAQGLNFPVGIAFTGNKNNFQVYVLESGHGLPSRCNNEEDAIVGGQFSPTNPSRRTSSCSIRTARRSPRPLAKPTAAGVGLLPHGPSVGIAFEKGFQGGRLFVTDSNQAIRSPGAQNNSSRIVIRGPEFGPCYPVHRGAADRRPSRGANGFKSGWIYWSQGSTTNSGVVGRDNGGGANQQDIPCQDIKLSNNVFDSGGGVKTSGYSPFGTQQPGCYHHRLHQRNRQGHLRRCDPQSEPQREGPEEHDRAGVVGLP